MTYLVLGSAGQVGRPLVAYLRSAGHEVLTYDVADDPNEDLRRHPYDDLFMKYAEVSDFIFFLAFDVGGGPYLNTYGKTKKFIDNNIKIMLNTFRVIETTQTPFLFTSSEMAVMQFSAYGTMKRIGEHYTETLGGIPARLWNVYGYEPRTEKSHVITDFIHGALTKGEIRARTTGTETRQLLYSMDCCECLYELSLRHSTLDLSKPYHIARFEWTPIKEVAKIVSELTGAPYCMADRIDDSHQGVKNNPDPFIRTIWRPKTSLRQGISEIVKEMRHA